MERDEDGHIASRRQRELTLTGQLDCQWSVRVTWKDIGTRGSGNKGFVVTVTCLDHTHELSSNPLSFPRHRQSLEEWQVLIRTARKHDLRALPETVALTFGQKLRVLPCGDSLFSHPLWLWHE